jgi:hypothetical protein
MHVEPTNLEVVALRMALCDDGNTGRKSVPSFQRKIFAAWTLRSDSAFVAVMLCTVV